MNISFSQAVCDYLDSDPPQGIVELVNESANSMPIKWQDAKPFILEANRQLEKYSLSYYPVPTPLNTTQEVQLNFII